MERPTCSTCPYWSDKPDDPGHCQRFPPIIIERMAEWYDKRPQDRWSSMLSGLDEPSSSHFPVAETDHWCGEHPDFSAYIAARKAKE